MAQLKIPVTPLDHTLADNDAPVTVVEYGDYECPHCAAAQPTLRRSWRISATGSALSTGISR
jgi:protein-disulfide isomerase